MSFNANLEAWWVPVLPTLLNVAMGKETSTCFLIEVLVTFNELQNHFQA
jgi:hypothetical protein